MKNSEILEGFILLQFLVVNEIQDPKSKKNKKQPKTKKITTLRYCLLRKNKNIQGF